VTNAPDGLIRCVLFNAGRSRTDGRAHFHTHKRVCSAQRSRGKCDPRHNSIFLLQCMVKPQVLWPRLSTSVAWGSCVTTDANVSEKRREDKRRLCCCLFCCLVSCPPMLPPLRSIGLCSTCLPHRLVGGQPLTCPQQFAGLCVRRDALAVVVFSLALTQLARLTNMARREELGAETPGKWLRRTSAKCYFTRTDAVTGRRRGCDVRGGGGEVSGMGNRITHARPMYCQCLRLRLVVCASCILSGSTSPFPWRCFHVTCR
jgi:hypothetical protein